MVDGTNKPSTSTTCFLSRCHPAVLQQWVHVAGCNGRVSGGSGHPRAAHQVPKACRAVYRHPNNVSLCLCHSVLDSSTLCVLSPELQSLQVSIKVQRRFQSKLKCIHPTISLLCSCHFCLRMVIIIVIFSMHYQYYCYVSQAYFSPSLSLLMLPIPSRYIFPPSPSLLCLTRSFSARVAINSAGKN